MKKINLDFNFKALSGEELQDSNAGQFLANVLVTISTSEPLKFNAIAQKLYAKETVELDPTDIELLKNTITKSETITNLAKAQLLLAL